MHLKAWSAEQAADLANCSRAQIYIEIREGRLKARKMGRKTLILDEDLNEYLHALPLRAPSEAKARAKTPATGKSATMRAA